VSVFAEAEGDKEVFVREYGASEANAVEDDAVEVALECFGVFAREETGEMVDGGEEVVAAVEDSEEAACFVDGVCLQGVCWQLEGGVAAGHGLNCTDDGVERFAIEEFEEEVCSGFVLCLGEFFDGEASLSRHSLCGGESSE